jgi:hypothetical protein
MEVNPEPRPNKDRDKFKPPIPQLVQGRVTAGMVTEPVKTV